MKKIIINIIISLGAVYLFSGCNASSESATTDVVNMTDVAHPTTEVAKKTSEWAIELVVEDMTEGLKNSGSRLGEMSVASDEKDKYDLKALAGSFSGKHLTVIFPIDGSGNGYNTDIHKWNEKASDSWDFIVKTNNPDSTMTISWKGIYALIPFKDEQNRPVYKQELRDNDALLNRMQLVDIDTNAVISVYADNQLQSYTFNMDGKTERTFRWELLEETVASNIQNKANAREMRVNTKLIREYSFGVDKVDPTKPPSIGYN
ncbi:MAG: hypothetical protein GQ531_08380 [Sulfurovum sp.]|nr:hypothetical protein [Sulfurovum sp.]